MGKSKGKQKRNLCNVISYRAPFRSSYQPNICYIVVCLIQITLSQRNTYVTCYSLCLRQCIKHITQSNYRQILVSHVRTPPPHRSPPPTATYTYVRCILVTGMQHCLMLPCSCYHYLSKWMRSQRRRSALPTRLVRPTRCPGHFSRARETRLLTFPQNEATYPLVLIKDNEI